MDDFDYNADPIITIPVGTMLYTGGRLEDNSTCCRPFYYVGQRGHMNDGKKIMSVCLRMKQRVIVREIMIVEF